MIEKNVAKTTPRGRIMFLHAKWSWTEAITRMLWLFTTSHATHLENMLSIGPDSRSPLQKLTATDDQIVFRDEHARRCPAYVLESRVQTSSKISLK